MAEVFKDEKKMIVLTPEVVGSRPGRGRTYDYVVIGVSGL